MAIEPEDLVTLNRLIKDLNKQFRPLLKLDAYLEGMQPLRFIHPDSFGEMNGKLTPLVINWPLLATDAYEHRLNLEGFRMPGEVDADQTMWDIWLDNDMLEGAQQAHVEALALGRAYAIVGADEDNPKSAIITAEHPLEVWAERDPRTKKTTAAVKRWRDDDQLDWATLYWPNETRFYARDTGRWVEQEDRRIEHGWGVVPVEALVNRGRLLRQNGRSVFQPILSPADAANKLGTDMMQSAEYHAMPRRWAFGLTEADFVGPDGQKLTTWEQVAGRLWATSAHPNDVKVGQFPEADLSNFHNSIKLLAQIASQLLHLPPHYMAFVGDNPASADAIRSSESQLVSGVERMQTGFGGAWNRTMQTALRVAGADKDVIAAARRMETVWRDAATPTIAQKSDSVQKLVAGGVLPTEGGWDEMGYSPQRKKRLREQFEEQRQREFGSLFTKPPTDPAPQPTPV